MDNRNHVENIKQLEEVNPVFTTAQACLLVMAEAGDPDAKQLSSLFGFDRGISMADRDKLTEMEKFQKMKAIPGFMTTIEARFTASSNLFLQSGYRNILDLPCGYTPRGLQFARKGIPYHGFDLPAVIQVMEDKCRRLYQGNKPMLYHAADATNYESLRSALEGISGDLFITTEGLLMYLTQSELEAVFRNIHRLLEEFDGIWVTTDNMIVSAQAKIMKAICGENKVPESVPEKPKAENVFFDPQQAEQFAAEMGFSLEKIPVYDYLPDQLHTLADYSQAVQNSAREAFREMYFWIMRAEGTAVEYTDEQNFFAMYMHRQGDILYLSLQGRVDTLTAPELLSLYRKENEKHAFRSVEIDMRNLDYISSAGLRVLMIMAKDCPENGAVAVAHLKSEIWSIFETSGFDQILCIRDEMSEAENEKVPG